MTHTSHKSHLWLWLVLGMLLVLVVLTLWHRWYWFFPNRAASSVYVKYHGTDGLKVAFVKDFPLNDTVSVDVTLLQATTDSAWQVLREDFGVKQLNDTVERINGSKATSYRYAPKKDYSLPMDTTCHANNDLLFLSRYEQTIGVFHIDYSYQIKAIKDWLFEAMINNLSLKTMNHEKQNN